MPSSHPLDNLQTSEKDKITTLSGVSFVVGAFFEKREYLCGGMLYFKKTSIGAPLFMGVFSHFFSVQKHTSVCILHIVHFYYLEVKRVRGGLLHTFL